MADGKEQEVKDKKRISSNTSSTDPKLMNARVFMGNFPADIMGRQEVEELFKEYGKILGISLHRTYGFVQYEKEEHAKAAVAAWNGKKLKGQVLDVNIATERRKEEARRDRDRGRPRPLGHRETFAEWERRQERERRWGRRSPSPGRIEHEMRMRHMEMDRMRMGPRFRGPPPMDPFFDDFPPPMRDRYLHPRDDPFDRFREPIPPRDLPPRDLPPRDLPPRDLPPRDLPPRDLPPRDLPPRDLPPRDLPPRDLPPRDLPLRDLPPRDLPPRDLPPRDLPPHRDLPPLRDYPSRPSPREPPPRSRDSEWEDYGRPSREHDERRALPPPKTLTPPSSSYRLEESTKPLDMQIIVVNKLQKEYAEHVRGKFVRLGLHVDVLQLSPTMSLADSLDEAAEAGLLYVVIISSQNEMHTSVTLTILHGRNPQEHKNMPLTDALGLVDRDFERYCVDVREGHIPARTARPSKPDMSSLLTKMVSGEQLRPEQLDVLINSLQRQKEASEPCAAAPAANLFRRPEAPLVTKESIESQQADLQAKILSLLGSSAVVPAAQTRSSQRTTGGSHSRSSGDFLSARSLGGGFGSFGRSGSGW